MNASPFAALVDPAEFGLIADYLRQPDSPIDHILHVRSESMLVTLAAELQHATPIQRLPHGGLPEIVSRRLTEGSIRISSRIELALANPSARVNADAVPRPAVARVLYLPPYYLAHTPGLFEGTLLRPQATVKSTPNLSAKRVPRMKF